MEWTLHSLLILYGLSAAWGKYVYVEQEKTWDFAQRYCQETYTDLAPISSDKDYDKLVQIMPYTTSPSSMWIGLHRDAGDRDGWKWSGGGKASNLIWESHQPDNRPGEDYGLFFKKANLHDGMKTQSLPFACFRLSVVRLRKTWGEAMQHCQENHRVLASLASPTEMLLAQKEIGKNVTTERVWTGMRYLGDKWLWVDGQNSKYDAWGQGGGAGCPVDNMRCAAFRPEDNSTVGTQDQDNNHHGQRPASTGATGVWEVCNCNDRLHFLCY